MRKTWAVILLLFVLSVGARAQFYSAGEDPGHLRWLSIESAHYRILYPAGSDSLARSYARLLEQYRVATGRSIGIIPGENRRRKMPVVLHTYAPYSNGSVGWAPSRMDFYTVPEPYGANPLPWEVELSSHEPRHQAQLSFNFLKPMNWIIGEGWRPVTWYLYIDRTLGEGDAVATETGITAGSRARTADFLNYYQVAFDQGDFRSWNQWRWGSYKKYTPDLYTVGYMTVAGARYLYNRPLIMADVLSDSKKHPWRFSINNFRYQQRLSSGKKFKEAFPDIMHAFNDIWQADAAARAPYTPFEQVSRAESFPVEYSSPVELCGTVYLRRSGYLRPAQMGFLQNGEFRVLHSAGNHVSAFAPEPVKGRLYWSETLRHPRWGLSGRSVIRYMDRMKGKVHTLTRKGRLYCPQPSPDGALLAVASAPYQGGSQVLVLSSDDGSVQASYPAPSGLQATEMAWMGEELYTCAISEKGYGIYHILSSGEWETVLEPSIQKVVNLGGTQQYLTWMSDRDGANALYHYYPASGKLLQMTSTRFGASDYCEVDGWLYAVSQTREGKMLMRAPMDSLRPREVCFQDVHSYPVEDVLTAQESALGPAKDTAAVVLSAPKRYYKLPHALRFHSWLPLYVNYDSVMEQSFDLTYKTASPGLSAFFQNTLGTLSGMVGYSLHRDPMNAAVWRNSLHAKMEWRGWYPVVEAALDFGDREAVQYTLLQREQGKTQVLSRVAQYINGRPVLSASVKTYVPLAWYKSGVQYGIIPQVNYYFTSDLFSRNPVNILSRASLESGVLVWRDSYRPATEPANQYMHQVAASLRGYVMRSRASSQIYPSWGVGAEAGYHFRPGIANYFTPYAYARLYGYLPGLLRSQGLKLSALYVQQIRSEGLQFRENTSSVLPRGFDSSFFPTLARDESWQLNWSVDYAIPIYVGELSMGSVAYIRNFVLTPYYERMRFKGGNLWSAGSSVAAVFGKLLMIPAEVTLGVSLSYLGGSWMPNTGITTPFYAGLVFDISL